MGDVIAIVQNLEFELNLEVGMYFEVFAYRNGN